MKNKILFALAMLLPLTAIAQIKISELPVVTTLGDTAKFIVLPAGGSTSAIAYSSLLSELSLDGGAATSLTTSSPITSTASSGSRWFQLDGTNTGYSTPFGFLYERAEYASGGLGNEAYTNNVMGWGWNLGTVIGGAPAVAGQPSIWYGFEHKYFQGGVYGLEAHLEIVDTGGTKRRPWTWFMHHDGSAGSGATRVDRYTFMNWAGVSKFDVRNDADVVDVGTAAAPVAVRFSGNNTPAVRQLNAAGNGYIDHPYVGGSNELIVTPPIAAAGTLAIKAGSANTQGITFFSASYGFGMDGNSVVNWGPTGQSFKVKASNNSAYNGNPMVYLGIDTTNGGSVSLADGTGNDPDIKMQRGSGSPEGARTAVVGSFYLRSDGGANTTFYVKESGTGNTGWIAK